MRDPLFLFDGAHIELGLMPLEAPAVGGVTGQIKVWLSGAWAAKPVKVWTGSAWVVKKLKFFNGTIFEETNY
jgi:hypothetical protein